jgi:hypothetical protein
VSELVSGKEKQDRIDVLRRINNARRASGRDPEFCDLIDSVLLTAEDVPTETPQ